jgi:hypothetical protein
MTGRLRTTLFLVIFILVLWFVLSRVHFFVVMPTTPLGLLAFIAVVTVVIFLLVDHLINRSR